MPVGFLLDVFDEHQAEEAMVWSDRSYAYGWLAETTRRWIARLESATVEPGSVVALEADFSPQSVALFLALVARRAIVVPLTESVETKKPEFLRTAQVETRIFIDDADEVRIESTGTAADHEHFATLRERNHPGLVLFSSGTSGKSKAVVHDFSGLLKKFTVRRHAKRTVTFFLFDHIGGVDTLLYTLSNGSCVITVSDRSPDAVCAAVERHRAEVLPVSPTFINLMLLSGAHLRHDLSSLEILTYGTEVMPPATLERACAALPGVRMLQKFGMSEVGTLRSKSRSSDSTWVKVGGEGYELRVRNGLLEIKAESAMLGYINEASPFTDDGWLMTGDAVEVDGDYVRFLGRANDVINIGGEKVHPAEVEDVLLRLPDVVDAIVTAEPHPITGQIACAHVLVDGEEPRSELRKRMRAHCAALLPRYKVPQKFVFETEPLHSARHKRVRRLDRPG